MAKYIDEQKLVDLINETVLSKKLPCWNCADNFDLPDLIQKLPAEDVAPIKHGKWLDYEMPWDLKGIESEEEAKAKKVCSFCREISYSKNKFCPNCGALMVGVEDGG